METDMGENLAAAYLKLIKQCDFIGYNVRPPVEGCEALNEGRKARSMRPSL